MQRGTGGSLGALRRGDLGRGDRLVAVLDLDVAGCYLIQSWHVSSKMAVRDRPGAPGPSASPQSSLICPARTAALLPQVPHTGLPSPGRAKRAGGAGCRGIVRYTETGQPPSRVSSR